MLGLRHATPVSWAPLAVADLDRFLQDHAANERKVSASALTLAVHHPERAELVEAMIDLAREELEHFKRVHDLLVERGRPLGQDSPDPYMGALHRRMRKLRAREYLLDRLIVFAIVEARGCERFALLARALEPGPLRDFYTHLTRAEARHHALFLHLAHTYYGKAEVAARLDEVLDAEAEIARRLPLRAALH
jgi:tRNA-(ms[2]io[6]A)-hydroxylase